MHAKALYTHEKKNVQFLIIKINLKFYKNINEGVIKILSKQYSITKLMVNQRDILTNKHYLSLVNYFLTKSINSENQIIFFKFESH